MYTTMSDDMEKDDARFLVLIEITSTIGYYVSAKTPEIAGEKALDKLQVGYDHDTESLDSVKITECKRL